MNDTPRVRHNGVEQLVTNYGCGRIAYDNMIRAFWQSRATTAGQVAPCREIVNLEELAKTARSGWPQK